MDKDRAHKLVSLAGAKVPQSVAFKRLEKYAALKKIEAELSYPLFVKPVRAGSSFGITKITEQSEINTAITMWMDSSLPFGGIPMDKNYSGIDYFRFVASLLIIAIHTSPFASFSETGDFILTRVVARVAVPFFLMTSGFFLISRYAYDNSKLWAFVKKTGIIYAAAIVIYIPVNILVSATLVFGLAACGNQSGKADAPSTLATTEPTVTTQATEAPTEATTQPTEALTEATVTTQETETVEGKTLVVYFSATGNTARIADAIVAATGADVLELEPVEPYSSEDLNWRDEDSRVVYEHDHPEERDVELAATTVSDWEAYDTVFVGYPIWWGIAAWPVDGFVAANDFTGKTVIPFATSSTSGLGESGELLAQEAGTGNWLEGMRFSSGTSETEVQDWVESLELTD